MKQVVYDQQEEMIEWAEARISHCRFREDAHAIGLKSEAGWHAVVIFDAFTTTGCWVSVASDGTRRWMTREFILKIFAYPFIQLLYPRINAFVSCENADSINFCEAFGWQREGLLREAGDNGEDVIIFGMLRRECRWLPERFAGKTGQSAL